MTLWEGLQKIGIIKRPEQKDFFVECQRFKDDPAFQLYLDNAKFNIISQMWALEHTDIEGFRYLKACQQAIDGLTGFVESAIASEKLKNR